MIIAASFVFINMMIFFTHIFQNGGFGIESTFQRKLHTFYARIEPFVVRTIDKMLKNRFLKGNKIGRSFLKFTGKMLWFLPHGVVIDHEAAIRLIDNIPKDDNLHIAIGPCVCKKAIGVNKEPYVTDMVIMYGAQAYKSAHPEEYKYISPEEAKALLANFRENNLIHEVFACFKSKSWTFVICNCDANYCIPTRSKLIAGEGVYAGPLYAVVDPEKCEGLEKCGICKNVCPFDAIKEDSSGKAFVIKEKCMGCSLCFFNCPNKARRMIPRENYDPKFLPIEYTHPNLCDLYKK